MHRVQKFIEAGSGRIGYAMTEAVLSEVSNGAKWSPDPSILDRHDVVDEFLAQLATPALLLRGLGRRRFVRPWKRSPAVQERRPRLWLRHGYGVRRYGYGVHRGYAYRRGYAYHHGYRRW